MAMRAGLHRLFHLLKQAYCWVRRPVTLGVRGAVFDGDGRVLLVRHTYMEGWYMPGGGVEQGETLEEAVRRELWEEVGVKFSGAPLLIGVYANLGARQSDHVVLFRVEAWTMAPNSNDEIAEHAFFALDALPPETSGGTRRRLAEMSGAAPLSVRW